MAQFLLNTHSYGVLSPYVIAEIGVNHEGDLDRAKSMIQSIAKSGAHAAKFQSYKADLLATSTSSPAYWDRTKEAASSQHELFQRWDTFGPKEYQALADECRNCGIDFMSTPFDLEAVDMVADISPVIKVASADLTNIPLLRRIGARGLPTIMSTGASRLDEIATGCAELKAAGAGQIALLHCVLNYPTLPADAQLAQIPLLQKTFGQDCVIGYSDHVKPDDDGSMPALEMAALMGAVVIEKHFTDDKSGVGNDHYHAMDEADCTAFMDKLAVYRDLYGSAERDISGEATAIKNARRRVVAARPLTAGTTLTENDLIALRSDDGIEIAHWDRVVGRSLAREVAGGTPLQWHDLS